MAAPAAVDVVLQRKSRLATHSWRRYGFEATVSDDNTAIVAAIHHKLKVQDLVVGSVITHVNDQPVSHKSFKTQCRKGGNTLRLRIAAPKQQSLTVDVSNASQAHHGSQPSMLAASTTGSSMAMAKQRVIARIQSHQSRHSSKRQLKTMRLFISSTFNDMRTERDLLARHVYPHLRALLAQCGAQFTQVDLRWGVLPDAAAADVIVTCLSEVARSQPYVVAVLGERYGWVPPFSVLEQAVAINPKLAWILDHEGLSVTHLEVLAGIFRPLESGQVSRGVVFLRDPSFVESLPADVDRQDFISTPADHTKLAQLKQQLQASDVHVESYTAPHRLPSQLNLVMERLIAADFPQQRHLDPLAKEGASHQAFLESRLASYIPFPQLDRLITGLVTGKHPTPSLLLGDSGTGKSSVMADLASRVELDANAHMVYHFTGHTSSSAHHLNLLRRVMHALKHWSGPSIADDLPQDSLKLAAALPSWLAAASAAHPNKTLYILLDALNQLQDVDDAQSLAWMPQVFPANVRIVASCVPGAVAQPLIDSPIWHVQHMPVFSQQDKEEFAALFLEAHGKSMEPKHLAKVVTSSHVSSLLHLRLVLDELLITGQYDTLDKELARLLAPATLGDFIPLVLVRLEGTFNDTIALPSSCSPHALSRGVVGTLLAYVAASRHGITEHELLSCMGLDQTAVATLFRSISEYVHSDTGLLLFAHDIFVQAVVQRYMGDGSAQQQVHRELAAYFSTLKVDDNRRYEELPWHYQGAGMLSELEAMLSDLPTFHVMRTSNEFRRLELAAYWRLLGLERAKKAYRTKLDAGLESSERPTEQHVNDAVAVAQALHEWGDYTAADELFTLAKTRLKILQDQGEMHASLHSRILEAQAKLAMHRSNSQLAVDLFEQAIALRAGDEAAILPALTDLCWAKIMLRDLAGDKGAVSLLKKLLLQHVAPLLKLHDAVVPGREEGISSTAWQVVFKLLELPTAVEHVAPMTASTLNRLALALSNQGLYGTAERLFTVSLTLHENLYGRTHPHVALVLNDLATVLLRQVPSDHVVAQRPEPYLYLAPEGHDPEDNLMLQDEAAVRSDDHSLLANAEAHYRRGLDIRRAQLGPHHPFTATSMMGLADLLLRRGRKTEAQTLYEEAFEVRSTILGGDNPQTQNAKQRLSLCV
eukprot:m.140640 g.140640  ORF g.140640 m.140640 type:complete len:1159 (+) comp16108_c0_seq2:34-3510(+)